MSINIRNTGDPFARYKMSQISISKIKNNTKINNLSKISLELHVPEKWIAKYISSVLGTAWFYSKDGGIIFRGIFPVESLELVFRDFIDNYVLCENCDLPELDYDLVSKKKGKKKCRACGAEDIFKPL